MLLVKAVLMLLEIVRVVPGVFPLFSIQLMSAVFDMMSFNSPMDCCCSCGVGTVVCWNKDKASKFMAVMFFNNILRRSSSSCFRRSCSCLAAVCASVASTRRRFNSFSYDSTICNKLAEKDNKEGRDEITSLQKCSGLKNL